MTTTQDNAIAAGLQAALSSAGRAVTYRRAASSVVVTAAVGKSAFAMQDQYGVNVDIETRDYLCEAASLVLSAATVTPQRGDEIVDGTNTYSVLDTPGQPSSEQIGPAGQYLRIHTRRKS